MTFYCRLHPDFEGLDMGKLHDHIEKDHREIYNGVQWKIELARFVKENIEVEPGMVRRSDGRMMIRTWGRPPKMGQFVADSDIEKK